MVDTPPMSSGHRPVRQGNVREHNLALVLRTVSLRGKPISRADIAAVTGLTRSTVSTLIEDLLAVDLVIEVAPEPKAGAGRPSVGLTLDPRGPAGLGLEINVDYLAGCVVDLTGYVRHRAIRHCDQRPRPAGAVLADIGELADDCVAAAAGFGLTIAGAAVAVPGLVEGQVVRLAPNLGWRDVAVEFTVAGRPVTLDNEANLAALGELYTDPKAHHSFVYVSGEIGIGAGIVVNAQLVRGARGFSGEIGHVPVHPDGPLCRCGARGCLEQYAGQEAILAAAGVADPADLLDGANAGDPAVLDALDVAASALGVVVAGMANLLDISTVVLGGMYAELEPWLRDNVAKEIANRVLSAHWAPVEIRPSALGADAAVIGAATSVVRAILDQPSIWMPAR